MKKSILACLLLFDSFLGFSQDTLVVSATKDTYINTVIADKVQGHIQSTVAAAWTYSGSYGQGRGLIGFEVCRPPDGFTLLSAHLYLYFDPLATHTGHTTNGLNAAKLFKITSDWTESTTWASQPSYDPTIFAIIPAAVSPTQNYKIDVTSMVTNMLAISNELGFYLKLDYEDIYRSLVFASRNHPNLDIQPKLEFVYEAPSVWCDDLNEFSPDEKTVLENCLNSMLIPNIFSPNQDDINDLFFVESDCDYSDFTIQIFNRWGALIYENNELKFEWNGKNIVKNEQIPTGVYFYSITVSTDLVSANRQGTITVVR